MIAASSLLSSLLLSHPKHFFRLKKHHFPSQGLCCFISIMTYSFMCFIILLLIGISTLFLLLKWDKLVCSSQICLMPLFFSQIDIIATLQFVDSCSFEKRELIAAPQWQGLMPVLPWWINLLWLKVCRCFCCGSQCHKLGWDILFYILIFLEKFRDSLMKNCLQTQKTLKISRKKKFLYSLEFI